MNMKNNSIPIVSIKWSSFSRMFLYTDLVLLAPQFTEEPLLLGLLE